MNWDVKLGERRLFITTSYVFKIELQVNNDVLDADKDLTEIKKLTVVTKKTGLEDDLSFLFNQSISKIISLVDDAVTIREIVIDGLLSSNTVDPNGVRIFYNK